jgi:hypothetical protein
MVFLDGFHQSVTMWRLPTGYFPVPRAAHRQAFAGELENRRDAIHNCHMTSDPTVALRQQFLAWIAASPRRYGDVMEAWRTTCPRLTIWEDAVRDGLVGLQHGGAMRDAKVVITARGKAALASQAASDTSLAANSPSPERMRAKSRSPLY